MNNYTHKGKTIMDVKNYIDKKKNKTVFLMPIKINRKVEFLTRLVMVLGFSEQNF